MDRRNALKNSALLAGLTVSGASLTTLMQSCQEQSRLDWEPLFFSKKQAETVSAMADTFLPTTETPGALDLKADLFVDLMCKKHLSPTDQEHVMKGCQEFMQTCRSTYGKDYPDLNAEEKAEYLKTAGEKANTFNPAVWGSPLGKQEPLDFYRRVKQFTLVGYFTSEEVGKNILVYDPIPAEQKGCIPVDEVGNAWTL